jgi:hypothetical protein
MFIWNTIGLLAACADLIYLKWDLILLLFIHPICAVVDIAYTAEFMHKHADVGRSKSLVLLIPGLVVFLVFRFIFPR